MAKNIFATKTGSVKLESSLDPILVSIVVHSARGGARTNCSNLPLLSIDELTTMDRVQVDCTLGGVFHILKAAGGYGKCTLTFLDAIHGCKSSDTGYGSALQEYIKRKRRDEGNIVDVTIMLPGEDVTFRGYLLGCNVGLKKVEGDIAFMAVTYSLIGDFDT